MQMTGELLARVDGGVGFITLNRPQAINSLSHGMVTAMDRVLQTWAGQDEVATVVVTGAGDRGLCAGGDVMAIYLSAKNAGGDEARKFWYDEYRLNDRIARFPKPYVAVMDGIVMGGGVGVSAHGSVRVVTENSKIAMPEVGIGFIPDVGGTYLLARAPGLLGLHAALTGAPFSGADAIAMGFADHFVRSGDLAAFTRAVAADGVAAAVATHAQPPPPSPLAAQRHWIDHCYTGQTVSDIVAALRDHAEGPANAAAELIGTRSPIALSVALASIRRAAGMHSLREALVQEYRVSCASSRSHDLVEGIRAQIVDKDRTPRWNPAALSAVSEQDVERYFQPAHPDLSFEEDE